MTNPPKFCTTCGAPVRLGGRFCAICGSSVAAQPPASPPPTAFPSAAAAAKPAPAESPVAPASPAPPPPEPAAANDAAPSAVPAPAPAAQPEPPSAPEAPWPALPPEMPLPPFGPETQGAPMAYDYAAPPPARKGSSRVPCIVVGCLGALVLLALGGWAFYTALGSFLPKALLPGLSFGISPTPVGQVTRPAEATVPPAVMATATLPPATPTPVPSTATRVPPTATATPRATSTPTATPTPVQVYTADFSGTASEWNQKTDASGRQYVQDSAYHVVVSTTTAYVTWQSPVSKPVFKDFTLEVRGRYESGPEVNSYGAIFRYVDDSNFYFFVVTANGKWGFAKRVKGSWTSLVPLTSDSTILKGKAPNTLRVVAKGPNFTFSVNGKQVGTFMDGTHVAGTVGVFTSNDQPGNFHVVYEALKATILLP